MAASDHPAKRMKTNKKLQESVTGKETTQKKAALVWSNKDNLTIMEACLDCVKKGIDFPKNVPQVMESVKDSIQHEVSPQQMYEKIRRFKRTYASTLEKMKQPDFELTDAHQNKMFELCESAWGEPETDKQQHAQRENGLDLEQEQHGPAGLNVEVEQQQQHAPVGKGLDVEEEHGLEIEQEHVAPVENGLDVEEEQHSPVGNRLEVEQEQLVESPLINTMEIDRLITLVESSLINRMEIDSTGVGFSHATEEFGVGFSHAIEEFRAAMTEFAKTVKNIVENHHARVRAMVENHLNLTSTRIRPLVLGGIKPLVFGGRSRGDFTESTRIRPLVFGGRSRGDFTERIIYSSVWEPPVFDVPRSLHDKWQKQQILEMEVYSLRRRLLEECSIDQTLNAEKDTDK